MHACPRTRGLPLLAAVQLIWAWPVAASTDCEASHFPDSVPKGSWLVHEENDALLVDATDKGYTQGLRLGYTWQPECEWRWTQDFATFVEDKLHAKALLFGKPEDLERWTSFGGGQHIFTPRNLKRHDLNTDDRPYAGWLYAMLRHDYATPENQLENVPWLVQAQTSFEYQLGIVGQLSLAEAAQKFLHDDITGSQHPNGWEHQLGTEPGVVVRYQWQGRLAHEDRWFDVVPDYSVALGNIQTYAGAGLTLRAGVNISGFPTRTLGPTVLKRAFHESSARAADVAPPRCLFSWLVECYVFANAEGRYFARNLFFDGSTWKDSHRVDKEPFVSSWSAGTRLRLRPNNITINYVYTWRSREFTPVPQDAIHADGSHAYGAITVNWDTHF